MIEDLNTIKFLLEHGADLNVLLEQIATIHSEENPLFGQDYSLNSISKDFLKWALDSKVVDVNCFRQCLASFVLGSEVFQTPDFLPMPPSYPWLMKHIEQRESTKLNRACFFLEEGSDLPVASRPDKRTLLDVFVRRYMWVFVELLKGGLKIKKRGWQMEDRSELFLLLKVCIMQILYLIKKPSSLIK